MSARLWFRLRDAVNWAVTLVIFVPAVFFLSQALGPLVGSALAIAGAFCLFFFYLHKRAVFIRCPNCDGVIATNTPWVCGNQSAPHRNDRVDDWPFIHRCEHCGFPPKAYQCHHCGELVFLTEDRQKTGFARCADVPAGAKPVEPDAAVELDKDIKLAELKVKRAELEVQLKAVDEKLNPVRPKLKTPDDELADFLASKSGDDDAVRKWKARVDEEWKDDPDERKKRHLLIEEWMRKRMK